MRFLLGLVALFIIPGSVLAFWNALIVIASDKDLWIPLICGFILGIPFYFMVIKKIYVISTFEHELTHALVALFFFRRIQNSLLHRNAGDRFSIQVTSEVNSATFLLGSRLIIFLH